MSARIQVEPSSDANELLLRYVKAHNLAVAKGLPDLPLALFERGAEVRVVGPCLSSSLRRRAILRAFRQQPLHTWRSSAIRWDLACAPYAWKAHPRLGGVLHVELGDWLIRKLTIQPGYSRIYAELS